MKISVQSQNLVDDIGAVKAYAAIAKAGFQAIDWNIDHALTPAQITSGESLEDKCVFEKSLEEVTAYYQEELDEIHRNSLEITQAHAPFPAYIPGREDVLDYMIGIYKKMILFCDSVGCKNLIVHGISLGKHNNVDDPVRIRELNHKLYTSLIPELRQTNVTVCLENLFSSDDGIMAGHCANASEAFVEIFDLNNIAGKECFGLCLDIGHLNLLKGDPRHYIPEMGDYIKALHLHDNDGLSDQHNAPYTGKINWKHFCEAMNQIGYKGDLSFETFHQTSLGVIDEEMVQPWLDLIYKIGCHFKEKIEG